jgi:hypothetical protein
LGASGLRSRPKLLDLTTPGGREIISSMKPTLWIAPGQRAFERTLRVNLPGFRVMSECRLAPSAFGGAPSVGEVMAALSAVRRARALI